MKKLFFVMPLLAIAFYFTNNTFVSAQVTAPAHPSGKQVQGRLQIFGSNSSKTVQDGEKYFIQLSDAPVNTDTKIWVDNGDGKGFRDFGLFKKTIQSNTAYSLSGEITEHLTLDCSSYEYLEPGQKIAVGNRDLFQKMYLEYVGLSTVSSVAWNFKDCSKTQDLGPTGNPLFPLKLESVYGRNNAFQPFPDAYASGMSSPLKKFAGRYFDGRDRGGTNTGLKFEWYTVYGSATNVEGNDPVKVVGDKIYTALGSTIAAYNKDTFISRLANKTNSSLALFAGTREPNQTPYESYDHAILPWDAYVYPEHRDNAWLREFCDCHTGITWFEVDDRGYVYFNDRFGFGIADPNMRIIVQVRDIGGLTFDGKPVSYGLRSGNNGPVKLTDMDGYYAPHSDGDHINVIKSGTKYYAAITGTPIGGDGGTRILDVTDPNNPKYVRSSPDEYIRGVVQSGDNVATIGGKSLGGFAQTNSEIKVYSAADFVMGIAPKKVFSAGAGGYTGLAVDKVSGKFYSIYYSSAPRPKSSIPAYILPSASVAVFSPAGGSYSEIKYPLSTASMGGASGNPGWNGYAYIYSVQGLDYENGYLVSRGKAPDGYSDIKIWTFKNGVPVELDTHDFIHDYYKGTGEIYQTTVHSLGGKNYLFVSGFYLADVYELEPQSASSSTPPPVNPTPTYVPPPASGSCTASITFDKASVVSGGSVTESWKIDGADVGQSFTDCGAGEVAISAGPLSKVINPTKTLTCRVYGKIGGTEKCTSPSVTVTVAATQAQADVLNANNTNNTVSAPASTSYNFGTTTLKQGSTGPAVVELQKFLNVKLNADLVVDGTMNLQTVAALKTWQSANGLVADGVAGPKTKEIMNGQTPTYIPPTSYPANTTTYNFGTTTLKQGSTGPAVKELQRFLNNNLNLGLVLDGKLGPKTIAVIKIWQANHGLVADGLVGPKTKTMMASY
jgi:peptidoglycan hydrolase-like protein with peptidoglycan-binding domain